MGDGGHPSNAAEAPGRARYVFGVRVRLAAADPALTVEPATFETRLFREATPPGEDGWLFFRDNLWRGELGDERFMREAAERALGVSVEAVDFRELRTEASYLDALKAEIADSAEFEGEGVGTVLNKYLGSSIHVVDSLD